MAARQFGRAAARRSGAMRIGLDLTHAVTPEPAGPTLYALSLARALAEEAPGEEWVALFRLSALWKGRLPQLPEPFARAFFWDRFAPRLAKRLDLFHGLESRGTRLDVRRQVVTLHEVNHLALPWLAGTPGASMRERDYRRAARTADVLVAPSEFERAQIVEHLGVSPDRVRAIPLAPAPTFRPVTAPEPAVLRRLGVKPPYCLFVGVAQPRKNLPRLLQAFARVRTEAALVLAGPVPRGYDRVLDEPATALGARLVRLGYVANGDVAHLMAGAACLAYPSLYESFGIPVVEAMACGCPVVTSDRGALPETCGSAAALCDPESVESIAAALDHVLNDSKEAGRLRAAGLARAACFSYRQTAARTLALYRELVG
jgi:glycosyltransferase involved in cell wall biosynthesis